MNDLSGRVAYVTGGSKGIGLRVAEALLKKDLKVAISGRTASAIEKAVEELSAISPDVIGVVSDVRKLEDELAAREKIINQWGQLDILIANAGVGHFNTIQEMSVEQWNEVIDINLTGVFHSVKAALPQIRKNKGYIITIASLAGTNFFSGGAAYNASKFGLVGFSQAIMLDLRDEDVKVSTIMPGSVATNFNGHTPSEKDNWKIQPEDIGQIVVDLLQMPPRTLPSKVEVRPSKVNR